MECLGLKTFTLKWSLHQNHLMSTIALLLDKKELVDCTILCTDNDVHQSFEAHRIVLAACSPFFSKLFSEVYQGPNSLVVLPQEIRGDDFKHVLHIIYHGNVTLPLENLDGVLNAARILKIQGLLDTEIPESLAIERKHRKTNPKYRYLMANQHRPIVADEPVLDFSNNHSS